MRTPVGISVLVQNSLSPPFPFLTSFPREFGLSLGAIDRRSPERVMTDPDRGARPTRAIFGHYKGQNRALGRSRGTRSSP